jgi:hypothetical protein
MKHASWNAIALAAAAALVLLAGPWFVSQMRSLPGPGHLAARAGQRIVSLEVIGLTGEPHARRVQRELSTVPGVAACEVRAPQRRAYAVVGAETPDSVLVNAVHALDPRLLARVVQP